MLNKKIIHELKNNYTLYPNIQQNDMSKLTPVCSYVYIHIHYLRSNQRNHCYALKKMFNHELIIVPVCQTEAKIGTFYKQPIKIKRICNKKKKKLTNYQHVRLGLSNKYLIQDVQMLHKYVSLQEGKSCKERNNTIKRQLPLHIYCD